MKSPEIPPLQIVQTGEASSGPPVSSVKAHPYHPCDSCISYDWAHAVFGIFAPGSKFREGADQTSGFLT